MNGLRHRATGRTWRWIRAARSPVQVNVHFGIPRLALPDLDLNVLPGWRIAAVDGRAARSRSISAACSARCQPAQRVDRTSARPTSAASARAFGDIRITGANIAPPALASVGALESVRLHAARARAATTTSRRWPARRRCASPPSPARRSRSTCSTPTGSSRRRPRSTSTCTRSSRALAGSVNVGYSERPAQSAARCTPPACTAADPRIAQYVSIPTVDYANGNLSGDIVFASGPVTVGPRQRPDHATAICTSPSRRRARCRSPARSTCRWRRPAAGANATGHISYDEAGSSRSRAPSPSTSPG